MTQLTEIMGPRMRAIDPATFDVNTMVDVSPSFPNAVKHTGLTKLPDAIASSTGYQHGSALVESTLYVYGSGSGSPNTFHSYDLNTKVWSQLVSGGPLNSVFTKLHAIGSVVYAIGGNFSILDIWKYDTVASTWTQVTITIHSSLRGFASCSDNGIIYIYGGDSIFTSTQLLRLDTATDTLTAPTLTGQIPPAQSPQISVVGGTLYLYGGYSYITSLTRDVWYTMNTTTFVWVEAALNNPPGPRDQGTMVAFGTDLFLIGGQDGLLTGNSKLEVWKYNTLLLVWSQVTTLVDSARAAAISEPFQGRVFIHGGNLIVGGVATSEFNLNNLTQQKVVVLK